MPTLSDEEALALVKSTGALLEGHFVLKSRLHSGHYVSKDLAGVLPHKQRQIAVVIADHFRDAQVNVVASPAVGALTLGSRVAEELGEEVRFVFVEQEGERFFLGRGYDQFITPGTRVLVVEDIITTGITVRGTMGAVKELDGEVVGIGLLWNRSTEEFDVPVFPFVAKTFPNYEVHECLLCKEGVPIDTKANKHGQEFLDEYGPDPKKWPANKTVVV